MEDSKFMQQEITNAEVRKDIEFIKEHLKEINLKLDQKYVSHDEFEPVKLVVKEFPEKYATKDDISLLQKVVYGGVGVVLLAVAGSIVALVINTNK